MRSQVARPDFPPAAAAGGLGGAKGTNGGLGNHAAGKAVTWHSDAIADCEAVRF